MYLHPSALETALLPYFLFVVFGAIALWLQHESIDRVYVKPEPAPTNDLDDVSAIDYGEPEVEIEQTDFVLSVPCPWYPDVAVPSLATEFEMEVIERSILPVTAKELAQLPPIPVPTQKPRKPKKRGLAEIVALEVKEQINDI